MSFFYRIRKVNFENSGGLINQAQTSFFLDSIELTCAIADVDTLTSGVFARKMGGSSLPKPYWIGSAHSASRTA